MSLAQLEAGLAERVLPSTLDSLTYQRMGNGDVGYLRAHVLDGSHHHRLFSTLRTCFPRPRTLVTDSEQPRAQAVEHPQTRLKKSGVRSEVCHDICGFRTSTATRSFIAPPYFNGFNPIIWGEHIFLVTLLEIHHNSAFLRPKAVHSFACG